MFWRHSHKMSLLVASDKTPCRDRGGEGDGWVNGQVWQLCSMESLAPPSMCSRGFGLSLMPGSANRSGRYGMILV